MKIVGKVPHKWAGWGSRRKKVKGLLGNLNGMLVDCWRDILGLWFTGRFLGRGGI